MGNKMMIAILAMMVVASMSVTLSCKNDDNGDGGNGDDDYSNDDDNNEDDDDNDLNEDNQDDDTSGSGSDDDSAWEEECGDNTPPDLLGVSYEVNGELVTPPVQVTVEDEVVLLIDYADADCNLYGGGWMTYEFSGNTVVGHDFNDSIACSSAEADAPYRAAVVIMDFNSGNGPFYLDIADTCSAFSERIQIFIEWVV